MVDGKEKWCNVNISNFVIMVIASFTMRIYPYVTTDFKIIKDIVISFKVSV